MKEFSGAPNVKKHANFRGLQKEGKTRIPILPGSGGSKSRLAKGPRVRTQLLKKMHAVVVWMNHISKSKNRKHRSSGPFWKLTCRKKFVVVVQCTFPTQREHTPQCRTISGSLRCFSKWKCRSIFAKLLWWGWHVEKTHAFVEQNTFRIQNLKISKVPILDVQTLRFYHSLNNIRRHSTTGKQYCTTPHQTLQSTTLHCITFHTLHCTNFRYTSPRYKPTPHFITTTTTTTFPYTLLYCTKLHFIPGPFTTLKTLPSTKAPSTTGQKIMPRCTPLHHNYMFNYITRPHNTTFH